MAVYLLNEAKIAVVPWGTDYLRISFTNSFVNLEMAIENMKNALIKLRG